MVEMLKFLVEHSVPPQILASVDLNFWSYGKAIFLKLKNNGEYVNNLNMSLYFVSCVSQWVIGLICRVIIAINSFQSRVHCFPVLKKLHE